MKPDISVIVPIYKTEAFLYKCLSSVCKQTFENIEIICVDDCSPDNSAAIVNEFMTRDPRIRFVRHESNLGLGGARNTAIKLAKADYLASIDSDDTMLPQMLETLFRETEDGRMDIVCCGYNRVDEHGAVLSKKTPTSRVEDNANNSIDIFSAMNPAFWNKIWRKELFTANNIYFPNHLYYQDLATTPRILTKAQTVKIIDDCLYNYLVRDDSVTYKVSDKHVLDYFRVFDLLKRYLVENDLLSKYETEFESMVKGSVRYHADNIRSSARMNAGEEEFYLKCLLMLELFFLKDDDRLQGLSSDALLNEIKWPFGEEPSPDEVQEAIELDSEWKATKAQKRVLSIHRAIFERFLNDHQKENLRDDPMDFFDKARNPVNVATRSILKWFERERSKE